MIISRHSIELQVENTLAIILYLAIPPSFLWHVSASFFIIFVYILLLASFVVLKQPINVKKLQFAILLSLLYFYIAVKDGATLIGIAIKSLIPFILLYNGQSCKRVINNFIKIYSLCMIPSLLVYCLVVLCGVELPFSNVEALNSVKTYTYRQYPFLVTTDNILSPGYYRFMSWFDEPGVVGTISGTLLIIKGGGLKSWDSWVLFLSGLLSFSLAFFIILCTNVLMFQSLREKMILGCLIGLMVILFYNNGIVNELLFQRLNVEDGTWSGDNRTTAQMESFMKTYIFSEKFLWGYGNFYAHNVVNYGGASYKDLLIDYGLFGFGLLCCFTIVHAYSRLGLSKQFFLYVFIWIAIIYQRPFITSIFYFVLLYFPVSYLEELKKEARYAQYN